MSLRLAVMALVLAGCAGAVTAGTSSTRGASPPPQGQTAVPAALRGFPVREVELDGRLWWVAVADSPERRAQGLMGVDDLGGLDGMLFVFDEPVVPAFWMKDTLIPLDVAFFDGHGRLVEVQQMEPCRRQPCPTYAPDSPVRWALEAPAGNLVGLPESARLVVEGAA
ncbi:MAG: DUF192 domain-containing protein [Actinomycetota bacterium]|nr:DUF192 domain-containing protein [Actinomycetota bacterium]